MIKQISFFPKEENKINEFIKSINSFGKIAINMYEGFFQNSTIFMNNECNNYEFILKEIENKNGKIKELKLIYRASKDGDSINNFFEKSDGIQNVILLIKTHNNTRFGEFTKIGFKKETKSSIQYKDNSAFVFSFDRKKYILLKRIKMLLDAVIVVVPNFVIIQFIYMEIFCLEPIILLVKLVIIMKDFPLITN